MLAALRFDVPTDDAATLVGSGILAFVAIPIGLVGFYFHNNRRRDPPRPWSVGLTVLAGWGIAAALFVHIGLRGDNFDRSKFDLSFGT